jgi:hypothetical protein
VEDRSAGSGLPRDLSQEAAQGKVTHKRAPRKEPARAGSGGGITQEPAGYETIGALEDPTDASPPYADVTSVSLQSDGSSLKVILGMAGAVPDHAPGDSEVVGIAVDLATDKGKYQLFASGENDGWFGYFDTPKGMKRFPGTFEIAGNQIAFTVPWSAFDGPRRGKFSVYSEWSSAEGYSEDPAPNDLSKVPFG